ncbi:MAG: GGDEF domain-containing protein [Myxococcales bacterium]
MFEEMPTSELWPGTLQSERVTYEHVLAEAGEQSSNQTTLRACRRMRLEGRSYYGDLLFVLTHKRYADHRAQEVWMRILCHRDHLTALLGRSPGVAVAALDYLTNMEGAFNRPALIDELKLTRLMDSATRDALTGLYDRETLRVCLKRALANPRGLVSVIMIDLDHFKDFNDRLGHLAGDSVLVKISALLRDSVRNTDMAARYGGEEFCVVLPERSLAEAMEIAERLRGRIERELALEGVTASFGVANSQEHAHEPHLLLGAADGALYAAKRSGRNRICSARVETTT